MALSSAQKILDGNQNHNRLNVCQRASARKRKKTKLKTNKSIWPHFFLDVGFTDNFCLADILPLSSYFYIVPLNPHCIENTFSSCFPCLIKYENYKILFFIWIKIAFILSYIHTINLLNIFIFWSNKFSVFFVERYRTFWHCNLFQLRKLFKAIYCCNIISW